jgi:hypothetical protein
MLQSRTKGFDMKFPKLAKDPIPVEDTQKLIRDEMFFLLERNERWFKKSLQAHLLDEGCNFPLALAKPRFYALMISGLVTKMSPEGQKKFYKEFPTFQNLLAHQTPGEVSSLSHEEFYQAMRFFMAVLDDAGKQMALEVTRCIETIKQDWQLEDEMFQVPLEEFTERVQTMMIRLWKANHMDYPDDLAFDRVRRRLYMALTSSLLSKMNVRQAFEEEFGSITALLQAMQRDHADFFRFIAFCRERTPYFRYIVSRTFWRTLETLRQEASR